MVEASLATGLKRPAATVAVSGRTWAGLVLVYAFVISLAAPIEASIYMGPIRLSPYRIVLIAAILPCLFRVLSGRAGGIHAVDVLVVLHAGWAVLALLRNHGVAGAWEFSGMYVLEIVGPYFLARCYIRSAADFEAFVRFVLAVIVILIPIAAYESFSGNMLRNPESVPDTRLGLHRAFGPFEHPILFGVFCASMLGVTFYGLADRVSNVGRLLRCGAVCTATFFSLSAGPLTALVAQAGLILWNRLMRRMRRRWVLLAACFGTAWLAVDLLSNRTPVHVFISYFTFNVDNAYNRILIWEYGTSEVARHPFFGIGLGEWERAYWMSGSMDNFWLVEAVRYGLPALLLLSAAIILLCLRIGRLPGLDSRSANCRRGWMVTVVGLVIAGCTVHYWNAIACFLMFLIGSGAWLAWPSASPSGGPAAQVSPMSIQFRRARRFPPYPAPAGAIEGRQYLADNRSSGG